MEEMVALRSILGDSFELLSGPPADALADEYPDPAELAAAGPVEGEHVECKLRIFVDVPSDYRLRVQLSGFLCLLALCVLLCFASAGCRPQWRSCAAGLLLQTAVCKAPQDSCCV